MLGKRHAPLPSVAFAILWSLRSGCSCGKQFNERTGTVLNRAQYPSDVIALVVLWRLRYKLSLRDLPEMFLVRRALCNILSSRLNFKLFPADRKLGSDSAPDNPCCSVRRSDGALISAV